MYILLEIKKISIFGKVKTIRLNPFTTPYGVDFTHTVIDIECIYNYID
jgi:hypothetical protein